VELEPLSAEIGVRSTRLADFHGDPADRLIVATALVLQMPLVTADAQIHRWNAKSAQLDLIAI
jgi:PIN domain nuclease of toxin-antitoxin system